MNSLHGSVVLSSKEKFNWEIKDYIKPSLFIENQFIKNIDNIKEVYYDIKRGAILFKNKRRNTIKIYKHREKIIKND